MVLLLGCPDTPQQFKAPLQPKYVDDNPPQVAAQPALLRLTRAQYKNTVRDLVGVEPPVASLPEDGAIAGFDNNASTPVTPLMLEQMVDMARLVAAKADVEALSPCSEPSKACAEAFIMHVGQRAFRRPMAFGEAQRYLGIYDVTRGHGRGHIDGLRRVVETLLVSPNLWYRAELGYPPQGEQAAVRLTEYELAAKLSYLFWDSGPDDELMSLADSGELGQPDVLQAQARRLLQDERARPVQIRFFTQWLGLGPLKYLVKDPERFPSFSADFRVAMAEETRRFLEHTLFEGTPTLERLLTEPTTFANGIIASLYELPGLGGSAFQKVALDPDERGGLLTQPAWLAVHSHPDVSSPVHRGRWVRERLLCQTVPSPPGELVISPIPFDPDSTMRERLAQHATDPSCAGCHALLDPLGLAFEAYDSLGRHYTSRDSTGEVTGAGELDGPVGGPIELIDRLATSPQVGRCVATWWFRFALGRYETGADADSIDAAFAAMTAHGGDLHELFVALVSTDSFRYRARREAP